MSPLQAQDKQTSVGHVTGVVDRTLNMAWLIVHTRQNQLNILIKRRIEAERKRHRTWETPCSGGGGGSAGQERGTHGVKRNFLSS